MRSDNILTSRVSRILRVKPADLRPFSLVEAHGKVFYVLWSAEIQ